MLAAVPMPEPEARPASPPRGPLRTLAARFALIAFAAYHLPLFLNAFPTFGGGGFRPDGLAHRWGHVFTPVGIWVARHVFHIDGPMTSGYEGDNGDVSEEYGRLLVGVVLAAVISIAWTIADRRRRGAPWVEGTLRVLLRYAIAVGLASYAVAKIYPVQFSHIMPITLEGRVGDLGPMRLLWAFMSYSRPYSFFAGAMELAMVVLLCFRRTSTLGVLIGLPVLINVALLNLCYDVVVKLFSSMMVISALVLLAFDLPRLVDIFLRHRPAAPAPHEPPFGSRRLDRWRWPIKLLVVGGVLLSSFVELHATAAEEEADVARPSHGNWDVVGFAANGRALAAADPAAWRRVALCDLASAIRFGDDQLVVCAPDSPPSAGHLILSCRGNRKADLHLTFESPDRLRLEGSFDGAPVTATLQRRAENLATSHFEWMYE
jgi:hypothetical protein